MLGRETEAVMLRGIAIVMILASCGGDNGISANDPLAGLDQDGQTQLCQDLIDTYQQSFDAGAFCTFFTVLGSLSQQTSVTPQECRLLALYCENQFNHQVLDPAQCRQTVAANLGQCDATVGDLEDCLQYGVDATSALFSTVTCDDVGNAEALSGLQDGLAAVVAAEPSGCAPVQDCLGALLPF
jgi:hypothetical protein